MAKKLDSLVFVYGTLKRGFLNYHNYLKPSVALRKAQYVCDGVTAHPDFCLVLTKTRKVPCLYRPQHGVETGYSVPGEIFRVDADALQSLDLLEGVDQGSYYRERIDIKLSSDGLPQTGEEDPVFKRDGVIQCDTYLKVFHDELVALENIPAYKQEHHSGLIPHVTTPELRVLACVYGTEITDRVQRKMDQGMAFDEAWKLVVG